MSGERFGNLAPSFPKRTRFRATAKRHVPLSNRETVLKRSSLGAGAFLCLGPVYPSATSKTIMRTKPKATPMVPMLVWWPCWVWGMSSSVTTYIMAPAAKAST